MNHFALIACLLTFFLRSMAWHKSSFQLDSELPKECGHARNFNPESPYESWGSWPWLGVAFYDGFGRGTRCNAVLIHPQVAISSLHCIKSIPEINLEEHLFIAFSLPGLPSFQNISVTDLDFTGETYNTGTTIAMMKLSKTVIVSANVQPICMWEENHDYSSQMNRFIGLMIGIDLNKMYEYSDMRIYQAPVHIIDKEKCNKENPNIFNITQENPLCFSYYRSPITCHGLGSPLIFPRLSESGAIVWYLRSVLTYRNWFCDEKTMVSLFDLADRRPWIESHFRPSTETRCGRRITNHVPLVLLGEMTNRGDWPWHAALFAEISSGNKTYRCGGSLISNRYVLTAGHCVMSNSRVLDGKLWVKLGRKHLTSIEDGSDEVKVEEIILHEQYDPDTLKNDIALLMLERNVTYNQYIQPVCLWYGDDLDKKLVYDKVGRVPGWGINEKGHYPDLLYVSTIPVVNDLYCLQSNPTFYEQFLTDLTFCAGLPRGNGSGVCNGDSGGGFVLPIGQSDNEPTWYLRGIVSTTRRKKNTNICDPDYYTIYTDVAKYLQWIDFHINGFLELAAEIGDATTQMTGTQTPLVLSSNVLTMSTNEEPPPAKSG